MDAINRIIDQLKFLYFESERPTLLETGFVVFTQLIALIILLSDFLELINKGLKNLIIIFIISVLLLVVWFLMRKVRLFHKELNARNKFFENIPKISPSVYKIKELIEIHEIEKNGDGIFHREVTLEFNGKDVYWYDMGMGSTHEMNNNRALIDIEVTNEHEKILPKILYKNHDSKLHYGILLEKTLTRNGEKAKIIIRRKNWKAIWRQLVTQNSDNGKITLRSHTEKLKIEFKLPEDFYPEKFDIQPNMGGRYEFRTDYRGRSCIVYEASQVSADTYNYSISGHKRKK